MKLRSGKGGGKQAKVDCKWIEKIVERKINGYKEKRFLWRVKNRKYPEVGRRTIGRGRGRLCKLGGNAYAVLGFAEPFVGN
jgi:hypothetical protein